LKIKAVAAGIPVVLGLALTGLAPSPAWASSTASYTYSCSKGGFTGYIYVNFTRLSNGRISRINWFQYKINKGRNHGGNKANVAWWDGSTAPATVKKTSRGVQDSRWHRLSGGYYSTGRSSSFTFTFDKSRSGDPRCGKATHMR
jgi:prepilin-type processing-associated H-X9-DG protein